MRRSFRISLRALVLAASLAALATPVGASWMIPPSPYRPKDFCVVKRDGWYHLFYIRRNYTVPPESTERDFGHARSHDLWIWEQLPPVLAANDTSWARHHVWAPSVVERDGVYYLFYTGVSDTLGGEIQRIGVATSTDLMEWNPMDEPIWSCGDVPWAVCDSLGRSLGFRDPYVMPDPAQPGGWLMYYSTYPASDSLGMVIGAARSSGDLTAWQDAGPLWITNRAWTFNTILESPHVFRHAGLYYLMYTTNAGQPISFATGTDPVGPPSTWTYRGRLASMLGVDTHGWFASEKFTDGLVDYFAFALSERLEFQRMTWFADWRFSLTQPDFMHVHGMGWSAPEATPGDSVSLWLAATAWSDRFVTLEALERREDGSEQPLSLDSLALPDTVWLESDTTRVTWVAHAYPDTVNVAPEPRIVVRLRDQTATAEPLLVHRPAPPDTLPAPPPPDPPIEWPPPTPPEDRCRKFCIFLRALDRAPVGGAAALLVQLDEDTECRLDLFDLHGRRIRNLAQRKLPAGANVLPWDGRTSDGVAAPPGLYFARLVTPDVVRTARVLLRP